MKVLLDERKIREGVARLAREIESHYRDAPLTIIGVMAGSIVLLADLIRQVNSPVRIGTIQARSYRDAYRNLPYVAALDAAELAGEAHA